MANGNFYHPTRKVITSTTTTELINGVVVNKEAISLKCMGLISKQKAFLTHNNLNLLRIIRPPNLYVNNLTVGDIDKDFICIDIKNCYPSIAIDAGLTSQEIFNETKNLKKNERLIVFGAMSSNKVVRSFNYTQRNGAMNFTTEHVEPINKYFFNNLMYQLSLINERLETLMRSWGINSYMIYCDAIFVPAKRFDELNRKGFNLTDEVNKRLTPNVNYTEDSRLTLLTYDYDLKSKSLVKKSNATRFVFRDNNTLEEKVYYIAN